MKKKLLVTLVGLFALGGLLAACGNEDKDRGKAVEKVKLGVVGEDTDIWDNVNARLKDQGIEVEIVKFSDYNQPNAALADGSIDLNAFQHQIFLDTYNEAHGTDLVAIGDTVTAPLGIYSQKIKDIKELKAGDEVSIPNDVTNGGRALLLLQTAGLIKVDPAAKTTPTPKDIIENKLNLKINELDAGQVARTQQDVAIALINNGLAVDAGLKPQEDAIFLEPIDETSKPYVNIIVARTEDKDNDIFKKIVAEYQTDETKKIIEETSKGSSIPAW